RNGPVARHRQHQFDSFSGRIRGPVSLMGAFAFLVVVAYVPFIAGSATTPRWAIMAIGAALLTAYRPPTKITTAHALLFSFLAWCAVSLLWSPVTYDALDALIKFAIFAMLFCAGFRFTSIRPFFIGSAAAIAINGIVMLAQQFGWDGYGIYGRGGAGLFWNQDM